MVMAKSSSRVRERSPGFSLLEVLISLTILTIVLGALYSTFSMVQNALDRFDGVSMKYHEARTALDMIRREIESSYIVIPQQKDIKKNKTIFLMKDRDLFGRRSSSLYLTSFPYRDRNLHVVSYFVDESDGILRLSKMEAPAVTMATLFSNLYKVELMEGIEGFSVETLFNDEWVGTWDSSQTNRLPDIVRVSIEFDDNGRKVTLREYARPKIGRPL
jgi:prepilin-type N-terminal cleavage/methylation domain-containing protein